MSGGRNNSSRSSGGGHLGQQASASSLRTGGSLSAMPLGHLSRASHRTAGPTAQQLSAQRAAKQATSDTTVLDHSARLQHLYRRIASTAGRTQRQHHQRGSGQHRSIALQHAGNTRQQEQQPPEPEWRALKAAAYPRPQPPVQPVQLPASQFYGGQQTNLLPSVQARLYKAALWRQVLQRRLYKAADVHALCAAFVAAQPLEQRALVRQVAGELLAELDCGQLAA